MKTNKLHIAFICILLVISSRVYSASVVITDPNFRQFLLDNHPSVLNPDQTLNTVAAGALNTPFKCVNKNLTNLSGIEYFTSITTLEVQKNPGLQSIPNIDGLTNITILGLDSNDLTILPNLSTLVNLKILSFHHNRIQSVPSIANLTQLEIFFVYSNNLTALPDLTNQTNLLNIICNDNPLNSLPSLSSLVKLSVLVCQRTNISSIPDLTNCVLLEYFVCTNNNVTTVPNLSACTILKEFKVFRCKLTSLPNLSSFSSLNVINVSNNELTFEDLLPLTSLACYPASTISPQHPGNIKTIDAVALTNSELLLAFDGTVSNNVYTWYKDGVFYSTTTENKLSFMPVNVNNQGIYTCNVTNTSPALTGTVLNAVAITLKVSPCIISNNIEYNIINTDCSYPLQILINEGSFTAGTSPYTYVVKNNIENKAFNTPNLILKNEGTYDLIVSDARGCEVNFESKLVINRHEKCDPVFYPNGDGIADTYYIENSGTAKIYDRTGTLIKELSVPNNWDGTNTRGAAVNSGLYVIMINESISIRVTIIR